MTRSGRNQMSEAFEGDSVAVIHELLHCSLQRKDFCHGVGLPILSKPMWRTWRDQRRRIA